MLSPPIGSQICGAEVWGAVGGLHAARPRPANRMSGVQGFTETPSLRTPPRYSRTVKRAREPNVGSHRAPVSEGPAPERPGADQADHLCPAPVLRTRVMRQPRVLVGRAVAMAPREVEHGVERPRRACGSAGSSGVGPGCRYGGIARSGPQPRPR